MTRVSNLVGAKPATNDAYLCTALKVNDLKPSTKLWIIKFGALTIGNRAHHMILSRCRAPHQVGEGDIYDCSHHQLCQDQSKILFAWAKHAEPTELPADVGFALDSEDYLVLQVGQALSQDSITGGH